MARFDGFLELPLNDWFVFEAHGRGGVTLRLNGETAFAFELSESSPSVASGEVDLSKGANPIELVYESPPSGAAELRLMWRNDAVRLEPVPPEVLAHRSDDELARGASRRRARELFASGRCHRCHRPPGSLDPDWMPEIGLTAPSLAEVGERLREGWIRDWLMSPPDSRPGTEMPAVLRGDDETVQGRAADLAAFLATRGRLAGKRKTPFSRSDPDRGAELYRELGCFTCHRLEGRAQGGESAGSWDLRDLQDRWWPRALAEYLLEPGRHHSYTRMPDYGLDPEEAEAIAAHLWKRSTPAGSGRRGGDPAAGEVLYAALACDACHDPRRMTSGRAISLDELGSLAQRVVTGEIAPPRDGCLGNDDTPGLSPRYIHSDSDRRSLWRFLASDLESLDRRSPPEAATRLYRRLRCDACHLRDGSGDLWSARAESPSSPPLGASAENNVHDARPPLTWAGEKLRPEWLRALLAGQLSYRSRPHLRARMPAFPRYARPLALGLAGEHGLGPRSHPPGTADPELADLGRKLSQVDQLGCRSCHGLGEEPALATEAQQETINFQYVPGRLRRGFYDRFVLDPQRILPGSMMPTFVDEHDQSPITAILDGEARRQFDAIWHLMISLADSRTEDRP